METIYDLPKNGQKKQLKKYATDLKKNAIDHEGRVLAGIVRAVAEYYHGDNASPAGRIKVIGDTFSRYLSVASKMSAPLAGGSSDYRAIWAAVRAI